MFWLATQMWLLLFVAFGLGLGLGWWIWGTHAASAPAANPSAAQSGTLALEGEAVEPLLYPEAVKGKKDDLTQIIGLDATTARRLNDIGVYYIAQIAVWDRPQAKWVEDKLHAPGRIHHERWIEQAKSLKGD